MAHEIDPGPRIDEKDRGPLSRLMRAAALITLFTIAGAFAITAALAVLTGMLISTDRTVSFIYAIRFFICFGAPAALWCVTVLLTFPLPAVLRRLVWRYAAVGCGLAFVFGALTVLAGYMARST